MNRSIGKALELGFSIFSMILLGVIIGLFLDSWLNTKVIFTLVGILLGVASAFWYLLRWAKQQ